MFLLTKFNCIKKDHRTGIMKQCKWQPHNYIQETTRMYVKSFTSRAHIYIPRVYKSRARATLKKTRICSAQLRDRPSRKTGTAIGHFTLYTLKERNAAAAVAAEYNEDDGDIPSASSPHLSALPSLLLYTSIYVCGYIFTKVYICIIYASRRAEVNRLRSSEQLAKICVYRRR